ncbi:hypothetical protein HOY80DRAFT_1081695 [Tuber brumale]|nr:hypothetical protein HOY80DRAFT_1081695 [Tuber brumale]
MRNRHKQSAILHTKELKNWRFPRPSLPENFVLWTLVIALLPAYITCSYAKKMFGEPRLPVRRDGGTFSVADWDEQGNPLGFHPQLDDLPLHPDKDGWHSVLGSWNGATNNPEAANEVNPEDRIAIPIVPVSPSRNASPVTPSIFCQYHKCSGNSGPHTCAPGRFTCEAPNCSWIGTPKTKQAFNRHYRAKHLNDRVDCPVEGLSFGN